MERPNPNDYVLDGYEKALNRYHEYLKRRIDKLETLLNKDKKSNSDKNQAP